VVKGAKKNFLLDFTAASATAKGNMVSTATQGLCGQRLWSAGLGTSVYVCVCKATTKYILRWKISNGTSVLNKI
jgi:hypothetical protein